MVCVFGSPVLDVLRLGEFTAPTPPSFLHLPTNIVTETNCEVDGEPLYHLLRQSRRRLAWLGEVCEKASLYGQLLKFDE